MGSNMGAEEEWDQERSEASSQRELGAEEEMRQRLETESGTRVRTSMVEELGGRTEEEMWEAMDMQGGYANDRNGNWYSLEIDSDGELFREYI